MLQVNNIGTMGSKTVSFYFCVNVLSNVTHIYKINPLI